MECDLKAAHEANIPILRRYSGGGTVYHDLGNVNYSLHRNKTLFDRNHAANMIISALKRSDLYLSPRHDIFIKDYTDDGIDKKVSGSAFKLTKDRAYNHGTMLLSADLSKIARLLKASDKFQVIRDDTNFRFGGVSSVPSRVKNVPNLTYEKFYEMVAEEYETEDEIEVDDTQKNISNSNISSFEDYFVNSKRYEDELRSWQWSVAKSPPFRAKLTDNKIDGPVTAITVQDGLISESTDPTLLTLQFDSFLKH